MPQETPAYTHLTDEGIESARHREAVPVEGMGDAMLELDRHDEIDPTMWDEGLRERRQDARAEAESLAISSSPDARIEMPGVEVMPGPEMLPVFMDAYARTINIVRQRAVAEGKVGDTTVLGYAGQEGTAFEQQDNTPMAA